MHVTPDCAKGRLEWCQCSVADSHSLRSDQSVSEQLTAHRKGLGGGFLSYEGAKYLLSLWLIPVFAAGG